MIVSSDIMLGSVFLYCFNCCLSSGTVQYAPRQVEDYHELALLSCLLFLLQDASDKVMQFLRDNQLSGSNPTADVGRMSRMAGGSC